jgi:hypothetical protein
MMIESKIIDLMKKQSLKRNSLLKSASASMFDKTEMLMLERFVLPLTF